MTLILLTIGSWSCPLEVFRIDLLCVMKGSYPYLVTATIHPMSTWNLGRMNPRSAQVFILLPSIIRNRSVIAQSDRALIITPHYTIILLKIGSSFFLDNPLWVPHLLNLCLLLALHSADRAKNICKVDNLSLLCWADLSYGQVAAYEASHLLGAAPKLIVLDALLFVWAFAFGKLVATGLLLE